MEELYGQRYKLKNCGKANIVGCFSSTNPYLNGINTSRRDTRYLLREIKRLEWFQTSRNMCKVKLSLCLTN
jgi:hypothetical protein